MIPVLHGVWASGGLAGDFEHIETQTVGAGGAASVTFSSIPGTYKHLQIRGIGRDTITTGGVHSLQLRLNGDSGSNYSYHALSGDGATAISGALSSQAYGYPGYLTGATSPASTFAANILDILDYTSTSKTKTLRLLGGADENGAGNVGIISTGWFATSAAITSITLYPAATRNFVQHSTFSLYGVK